MFLKAPGMASELAFAHPDIRALVKALDEQMLAWGLGELAVTDILRDPSFYPTRRWSWHYAGCAVDLRTRNLSDADKARAVAWVQGWAKAGSQHKCDAVLESDHLHVEVEDWNWRRKYEQRTGQSFGRGSA